MKRTFSSAMSELRRERNLPQRRVAAELHISQAQLSHYENGIREPGLDFVCRACDYYGVTADYLLGREERPESERQRRDAWRALASELRALTDRAEKLMEEMHI